MILGVTGGIAAYKAVEVCRRLIDLGAHVTAVDSGRYKEIFASVKVTPPATRDSTVLTLS